MGGRARLLLVLLSGCDETGGEIASNPPPAPQRPALTECTALTGPAVVADKKAEQWTLDASNQPAPPPPHRQYRFREATLPCAALAREDRWDRVSNVDSTYARVFAEGLHVDWYLWTELWDSSTGEALCEQCVEVRVDVP